MSFFQSYFDLMDDEGEAAVCCPFPHTTPGSGITYYEQHPSAHVNIEREVFHCKVCQQGHNEQSFVSAILGCTYGNALRLLNLFKRAADEYEWVQEQLQEDTKQKLFSFNISPKVIEELQIKSDKNGNIAIPALVYGKLLDIRKYDPDSRPKIRALKGTMSGLIIPFDLWRHENSNRITVICAGEKDMAVARSHGFNAITITGGENTLPVSPAAFEKRKVIIAYDNDPAGKTGAIRLANYLKPICDKVYNCINFHEVCKEKGEDLTDFFNKYKGTREDLIKCFEATPEYEHTEVDGNKDYPTIDLHTASSPEYVGKIVRSNIQVVAVSEATFAAPTTLIGEKYRGSDDTKDTMVKGEVREWVLTENTSQDILHMIDNNFDEKQLAKNYRDVLRILQKERYVKIRKPHNQTVYKCYVTDMFETTTDDVVTMEYTAYSIGCKLESGKKYLATYKLAPHPYKGQQLTMIILDLYQANDSVSNFKINDKVIENLKVFQNLEGTVEERITENVERIKGILGYDGNNTLITVLDLAYHTVLNFDFGINRNVRGYLDTLVVGESRMGKSTTANTLRETYGLGTFVSLAGNAATIAGLIGGSNKVAGTYQTRAGIIPQNHKGLLIFEELGKCGANVLAELTDIRSSNEVRITRVSGTLSLPATVRMLSLTNVKSSDGTIKPIASYPHGISILQELVGTAEDIARYDLVCILGDRGSKFINPLWSPKDAFPVDAYRTRVRWIWSRRPECIIIEDQVGRYIVDESNRLNDLYDCHIKIFGTEAWKKITRLAIAVAGYLVSTDESYEKIIVKSEHVKFAVDFLVHIYDNDTFKFKEYVEHERKYSQIDDEGVELLQEIYMKAPGMLLHLEQVSSTSKNALTAATGMTNDEYNAQMTRLVSGMFVIFSKYDIIPTERFRKGMTRVNRNTRMLRVGESR